MPQFEPDGGKNEDPATLEDYEHVRAGTATPEQVARVREALSNKSSRLYLELGESAMWARWMIERKYATPPKGPHFSSPAHRNLHIVTDYLCAKRDAGALSQKEVDEILRTSEAAHLDGPILPTPSIYAMYVTRTMRAIVKLRPDLADEVRNLPISRKR